MRVDGAEDGDADDESDATSVLVVDDEAVVRDSYSMFLEAAGYDVTTVADGDAALETVDDDVDVVLLDRRMPGQSGDDVLAEIRGRNVDCRIALVTAVDPDFDIVQIDCDDYLVKPVDPEELVAAVERLELRAQYSETWRELSSLRVKRSVLEVEKYDPALDASEEFANLEERIAELEAELEGIESEFDAQLGY